MGIYSIQDLLDHRANNPWSKVDLWCLKVL
jgi:hypothetical protein